jgi:hypothetical protein
MVSAMIFLLCQIFVRHDQGTSPDFQIEGGQYNGKPLLTVLQYCPALEHDKISTPLTRRLFLTALNFAQISQLKYPRRAASVTHVTHLHNDRKTIDISSL